MTRLFLLLLVAITGSWYVASAIKEIGPGYVYVFFNQYSIETSVWFALFLLICLVLVIFLAIKIIPWGIALLSRIGYWPSHWRMGRAKKLSEEGRLAFLNGHWSAAIKKLQKAGKNSEMPFIDFVMAARAALQNNDIEKARQNAELAKTANAFDELTWSLLQLDIAALEHPGIEQEVKLQQLMATYSTTPAFLARMSALYCQQQKWHEVRQLIPQLKKYKVVEEEGYKRLLADMASGLMPTLAKRAEIKELKALWKSVAKVHDNDKVIAAYCQSLVLLHEETEARKIIEMHLKRIWSDVLIKVYVDDIKLDRQQQLAFVEGLIDVHGKPVALLIAIGRLSKENGHYAKAREHYLESLQLKQTSAALEGLADLAAVQHDYGQAVQLLQQALQLKTP